MLFYFDVGIDNISKNVKNDENRTEKKLKNRIMEKKKMHVFSMKPIEFMVKGEKGFISSTNIFLVVEGESLEDMKLFLYIQKKAPILAFESDGYLSIEKIGDTNETGDFYIDFPQNIHYPFLTSKDITDLGLLPRVEISFTIATSEEIVKRSKDYSKLTFDQLVKGIWAYLDAPDFSSKKKQVDEMMSIIPSSLKEILQSFDDEGLSLFTKQWEEELEEEQQDLSNGERKETLMLLINTIISLLQKEKQEREKRDEKKIEISELEKMDIPGLDKKLGKSIANDNFERAAIIRDIKAKKQEKEAEWLYHSVFLYWHKEINIYKI